MIKNNIVKGNKLIKLNESDDIHRILDECDCIIEIHPNESIEQRTLTMKSVIRCLNKRASEIESFPENMTLIDFYAEGQKFKSYEDDVAEDENTNKTIIRPGAIEIDGYFAIKKITVKINFENNDNINIEELIALSKFINNILTFIKIYSDIEINKMSIDSYTFNSASLKNKHQLEDIYNKIKIGSQQVSLPFDTIYKQWNNTENLTFCAKKAFSMVQFVPKDIWISCDDTTNNVSMIVKKKRNVKLGEIKNAYFIFKTLIYPDDDMLCEVKIEKGGHIILDINNIDFISNKDFKIKNLDEDDLVQTNKVTIKQFMSRIY